jgi:adenylyl cyclase-associated protein
MSKQKRKSEHNNHDNDEEVKRLKVENDQLNLSGGASSVVPSHASSSHASSSSLSAAKTCAKNKNKNKNEIFELRGKKWAIQNHIDSKCTLDANKLNKKHTVYIYNCSNTTIEVPGKVTAIIVDGCTNTNVIFNHLIGACEIINCKKIQIQANGCTPIIQIDGTKGCVVYAGRQCFATVAVVESNSSELSISWPGTTDDDAWNEAVIPVQYKHRIVNGLITSVVQ